MEPTHLDALARTLSRAGSRRAGLRVLLGTLLGGGLLGPSLDALAAPGKAKGKGNGGDGTKQDCHPRNEATTKNRKKDHVTPPTPDPRDEQAPEPGETAAPERGETNDGQRRNGATGTNQLADRKQATRKAHSPDPADERTLGLRDEQTPDAADEAALRESAEVSATTCLPPGAKPCRKGSQCCSGRCNKKKRKCLPCLSGTEYCAPQQACVTVGECRCPYGETVCAQGCKFTSVSAAIAATPSGGTIRVLPGTYDADLVVSKNLTLTRCGDSGDVILRNKTSDARAVTVRSGVTATLKDLTISRQPAFDYGGGVLNQGVLSLDGCTVSDNRSPGGGGVHNDDGTLSISQSTFTGNTGHQGGAVFSIGDLTITDSTFGANAATFEGGGIFAGRTLSLQRCEMRGNTARVRGGGLSTIGDGTATLADCAITGNTAGSYGGGVSVNAGGRLIMQNCTILENTTQQDSTNQEGGGLSLGPGEATLTGCTISRNRAHKRGGGIHSNGSLGLQDCTISDNDADEEGGGIYNAGATITVSTGDGTGIRNNRARSGAGIYNSQGTVSLASCAIDRNEAALVGGGIDAEAGSITFVAGGGSSVTNNTAGIRGGGILARAQATVTLNDNTVSGNAPDNCSADSPIAGCSG